MLHADMNAQAAVHVLAIHCGSSRAVLVCDELCPLPPPPPQLPPTLNRPSRPLSNPSPSAPSKHTKAVTKLDSSHHADHLHITFLIHDTDSCCNMTVAAMTARSSKAHLEVLVQDEEAALSIAFWVSHCTDLHKGKVVAVTDLFNRYCRLNTRLGCLWGGRD